MKFFMKDLRATRNGLLIMLGFQALLFLCGVVIVLVINATVNKDQDYAAIGSMMALIGTVFGGLARNNGSCCRYRLAICMGNTRRSYLLTDPLITALIVLVGIGRRGCSTGSSYGFMASSIPAGPAISIFLRYSRCGASSSRWLSSVWWTFSWGPCSCASEQRALSLYGSRCAFYPHLLETVWTRPSRAGPASWLRSDGASSFWRGC